MDEEQLIPHLFRTEFRKITAVLCRHFGMQHIELAEDVAAETFVAALETWPYKGIPANPVAWLYTVAKNKARNLAMRHHIFSEKVAPAYAKTLSSNDTTEIDLSEPNITDSQLQMLFAICHPAISAEAQIGLALRILCGFGIDEIANAFLTNRETIQKRLYRAKQKLKDTHLSITFPAETELPERLRNVLTTLYLLFSEGYYSESNNNILREDLCLEAMRLTQLLTEYTPTNQPPVKALLALMCFHASRFAARKNERGDIILYHEQDETLWNTELIAKGATLLHEASYGKALSVYHLEANIAYWHTRKDDTPEKWAYILQLYNHLLRLQYSPVAALNRTYAYAKVHGAQKAIAEAGKLQLEHNQYYHTLLGELYRETDKAKAATHFQAALLLAKTAHDRNIIQKKLDSLR